MKSQTIIVTITILAVVALGIMFLTKNQQVDTTTISGPVSMDTAKSEQYVEYSQAELEKASQKRRVLFFYANWCPTCRPADESFNENQANIPEDVVVIRVNYNDSDTDQAEKDLARKYGIGYQHTFVQIDSEGNQVAIWNGGEFDEMMENLK
ncbi:hypothetical protein A3E10_01040 [Candidatus Roizmanbacteria bacterium RIFCSPHIGHO2_12_FULL_37_23]|nr:MAG: hypothetical protein A3E10_01040 [Candidatus Roizmanbacteria bacterium RIFCSPHIGHO2_12_FULL_37_23]